MGRNAERNIQKKFTYKYLFGVSYVAEKLSKQFLTELSCESEPSSHLLNGEECFLWMKNQFGMNEDEINLVGMKLLQLKYIKEAERGQKTKKDKMQAPQNLLCFSRNQVFSFNVGEEISGVLDLSARTIAEHLFHYEFQLFQKISLSELSSTSWRKGRTSKEQNQIKSNAQAKNVNSLIMYTNTIIYWTVSEILMTVNTKKRIAVLNHFISIANHCFKIQFFNGLFEIMAGLNMGPVRRLKETWKGLSSRTLDTLLKLEEFTSTDDNWRTYREYMKSVLKVKISPEYPIFPYFGLILKDLSLIEDGNRTKLDDGTTINFQKMYMCADILKLFRYFQEQELVYPMNPSLQKYLIRQIDNVITNEQQLYAISKEMEPKDIKSTKK